MRRQFMKTRESGRIRTEKFQFITQIRGLDMFSSPIASFNLKGQRNIKTNAGAFLTLTIAIIVIGYASIKLIELNDKKNPVMTSYEKPYSTDLENPINLNEVGFRFAFAWSNAI